MDWQASALTLHSENRAEATRWASVRVRTQVVGNCPPSSPSPTVKPFQRLRFAKRKKLKPSVRGRPGLDVVVFVN